jgi:hypothetical protein
MEIKANVYNNEEKNLCFYRKKAKKCALGVDFVNNFWYNYMRLLRISPSEQKSERKGEKYVRSSKAEYVEAHSRGSP